MRRLRQLRDGDGQGGGQPEILVISATDPLNLVGILTDGGRVPAVSQNRVAMLDGRAVAAVTGSEIEWLEDLDDRTRELVEAELPAGSSAPSRRPVLTVESS